MQIDSDRGAGGGGGERVRSTEKIPKPDSEQYLTINATQIQLPSDEFYYGNPADQHPYRLHPEGPSFRVKRERDLTREVITKIQELDSTSVIFSERTETYKSGDNDNIGVSDPSIITTWLLSYLAGCCESVEEVGFYAKVRDRAVLKSNSSYETPWKRSPGTVSFTC